MIKVRDCSYEICDICMNNPCADYVDVNADDYIALSCRAKRALCFLSLNFKKSCTNDEIGMFVWKRPGTFSGVPCVIFELRKFLNRKPIKIITIRNAGYMLAPCSG